MTQTERIFRTLQEVKPNLKDLRQNPTHSEGAGYADSEKSLERIFGKTIHTLELCGLESLRDELHETEAIQ